MGFTQIAAFAAYALELKIEQKVSGIHEGKAA